jgi:hypothetical protein
VREAGGTDISDSLIRRLGPEVTWCCRLGADRSDALLDSG